MKHGNADEYDRIMRQSKAGKMLARRVAPEPEQKSRTPEDQARIDKLVKDTMETLRAFNDKQDKIDRESRNARPFNMLPEQIEAMKVAQYKRIGVEPLIDRQGKMLWPSEWSGLLEGKPVDRSMYTSEYSPEFRKVIEEQNKARAEISERGKPYTDTSDQGS
jgi:hypothetical protein